MIIHVDLIVDVPDLNQDTVTVSAETEVMNEIKSNMESLDWTVVHIEAYETNHSRD